MPFQVPFRRSGILSAALVSVCTVAAVPVVESSPRSRAETRTAYALAYDLQFPAAYEVLESASTADPSDPAPRRAIAAITWMEILFAQGVATFEAFGGEISKSDVVRPPAPPTLVARFRRTIDEAKALAAQQLARSDDADACYQMGATKALLAVFGATVEGKTLGSLSQGRAAVSAMVRARQQNPQMHEAALVLGMSAYTVSTMSWPVRLLARMGGLAGDRDAALALLEEAATAGSDTQSDAEMLLMIVDNREQRHADALSRLIALERRHPHNRLLALNHGAAALLAGQPATADRVLTPGIAARGWEPGPAVLGEPALWFAHRGTARVRLQRPVDAKADLLQGLTSRPRDWVRGRIHAELGELAISAGERAAAQRELQAAVEYSERGGDANAVKAAKQKLRSLGR